MSTHNGIIHLRSGRVVDSTPFLNCVTQRLGMPLPFERNQLATTNKKNKIRKMKKASALPIDQGLRNISVDSSRGRWKKLPLLFRDMYGCGEGVWHLFMNINEWTMSFLYISFLGYWTRLPRAFICLQNILCCSIGLLFSFPHSFGRFYCQGLGSHVITYPLLGSTSTRTHNTALIASQRFFADVRKNEIFSWYPQLTP